MEILMANPQGQTIGTGKLLFCLKHNQAHLSTLVLATEDSIPRLTDFKVWETFFLEHKYTQVRTISHRSLNRLGQVNNDFQRDFN